MNQLLKKIKNLPKSVLRISDIEKISDLGKNSLRVTLHRLAARGELIRLSRGLYRHQDKEINLEQLACELGYPAYISCESALSHHGLTHQIPYRLELMTAGRSHRITIEGMEIVYHHLQKKLFKDYEVRDGISMATPEKAIADLRYLERRGLKQVPWDEIRTPTTSARTPSRISP